MSVAVVALGDYNASHVQEAVGQALELLGGLEQFIQPGMRVFIKPNLMRKSTPDLAAVTHPAIVEEVARRVIQLGATAIIGDSPGGPYNKNVLKALYAATGMEQAAQATGAQLNLDCRETTVHAQGAQLLHEFPIVAPLEEADAVINIAKLKSHTLATYSGATKNLYGVIPGLVKAEFHFRFQALPDFTNMLLDVAQHVRPVLNLIDAVVGMEGEGPGSGTPKKIGALVASPAALEADVAAIRLVGYDFDEIPLLVQAEKRGLVGREVEVLGVAPESLAISDWERAEAASDYTSVLTHRVPSFLVRPLDRFLALQPSVRKNRCVGCGICQGTCPVQAIHVEGHRAVLDKKKCIRCFCCMEFCPHKAIGANRHWIFKAAIRLTGSQRQK